MRRNERKTHRKRRRSAFDLRIGGKRCHTRPTGGTEEILKLVSLLLLLFHAVSTTAYTNLDKQLRELHHNGTVWPVTVANFGNQLEQYDSQFDLVLPPEDDVNGTLCSVSTIINPSKEKPEPSQYTYSIGLFVALGDCSPETKAHNLLTIRRVIPRVSHLVVYGTDPRENTTQIILLPDSLENVEELENNVAVLYVPTSFAVEISARIQEQAIKENKSPFFLDPDSEEFWFRVTVKGSNLPNYADSYTGSGPEEGDYDEQFLWFRFVLFSLLIVAPCVRAGFLWYKGGGRIFWRRNEHGHIVGLQYIPPMPYWLAAGRFIQSNPEAAAFTLTEEQFAALPEIKYEPVDTPEANDSDSETEETLSDTAEKLKATTTEKPASVTGSDGPEVVEKQKPCSLQNSFGVCDSKVQAQSDVEIPLDVAVESISTQSEQAGPAPVVTAPLHVATSQPNERILNTTTCTTCSICIDDFEAGEALVLLPRCRHAFHKDCLRPWLLERHGCCPLCKTDVLPPGHQTRDASAAAPEGLQQLGSDHEPSGRNRPNGGTVSTADDVSLPYERIEF